MQIYKTRWFVKFARRERIDDRSLAEAIARAERGLIDADLGGGLIKQRVAHRGHGKSGGYRMLVAYRSGNRAVFLYGFAKNDRDNISADDLAVAKTIGAVWLAADAGRIERSIADGELKEIFDDEDKTKPANGGPA